MCTLSVERREKVILKEQLENLGQKYIKSGYGEYLLNLLGQAKWM